MNYDIARTFRLQGKLDSASFYLYQLFSEFEKLNTTEKIELYLEMGVVMKQKMNYSLALRYFEKGMKLADNEGDKRYGRFLNNIGRIYYSLGNLAEAMNYFRLARSLNEKNEYRSMAIREHNIGSVFQKQNELDSALFYYNLALRGYRKCQDSVLIAYALASMSEVVKNKKEAYSFVNRSISMRKRLGVEADLMASYLIKARLLLADNRFLEAETLVNKIVKLQDETGHRDLSLELLKFRSELFQRKGKMVEANEILNQYIELREKFFEMDINQQLLDIDEEVKFRSKNLEIQQLNENDSLNKDLILKKDAIIRLEKDQLIFYQVFSLIFSLIVFSLILIFRKIRNQNKKLKEQGDLLANSNQQKALLLKELNHRVKNNLQIVSSQIKRTCDTISDSKLEEQITKVLERIDTLAILHDSLFIVHNDFSKINLSAYLRNVVECIVDSHAEKECIEIQIDDFNLFVNAESAMMFGHLVVESTMNSLKYVNERKLTIFILKKVVDDNVFFDYKDNGSSFCKEYFCNNSGFGHILIGSYAFQISGEPMSLLGSDNFHLSLNITSYYER